MFNWAVSRGEMVKNPCALLRPPVTAKPRDRVLSDTEIAKVLTACADTPTPFNAMVQLLMLTGARRNEVAHMQWSELSDNVWTIPASRAKNGRANMLPLPPAAMRVIGQQPRGDRGDYIFTTSAGVRPSSNFSKCKKALDQASGVEGYRLHDLRRVARTKLSQLQVPWEVARRILGHSVDALDATYDRFDYRTAKADALQKLADHVLEIRDR